MSRRKHPPPAPNCRDTPAPRSVAHPEGAGIDVHSDRHLVGVPPGRDPEATVRQFGANTCDLNARADWLQQCRIPSVAMESPGVSWIPLVELLEARGLEVSRVEPGQLAHGGARPKTDVLDGPWIPRLYSSGLLRCSFRPPDSVLALRGYWRQRPMQVRSAASPIQHIPKALEPMTVQLTEVLSAVTGVSGMAILEALRAGQRDPQVLARLRSAKCRKSEEEIARALEGTWRPEHIFAVKPAHEL